jgi:chromosome segregation ATPase
MRTSTVFFLVIFLCFASSKERFAGLREVGHEVRAFVHELTGDSRRGPRSACDDGRSKAVDKAVREIDDRIDAAAKAERALDRSIRSLEDRRRELRGVRSGRDRSLLEESDDLLARQIGELKSERERLEDVVLRLRAERAQAQAAAELARVQLERRAVEAVLGAKDGSPLDRLAFYDR